MGRMKVTAKHCRRIGENLTGQEKFKRILAKRNYAPGIHGQRRMRRISEYGTQLKEKQKARYTYGLREKQFRKYYEKAVKADVNTTEELMRLLERRLDNVIYRMGLAATRAQARQVIGHQHIRVNGKRVDIPSYLVKAGDIITLREKSKDLAIMKTSLAANRDLPEWLDFDPKKVEGHVVQLPKEDDLKLGIDTRLIIEFYSK